MQETDVCILTCAVGPIHVLSQWLPLDSQNLMETHKAEVLLGLVAEEGFCWTVQCCTSLFELLDFTVQVAAVVTIFYFQPLLGLMSPPFCHTVLCQAGLGFAVARGVQKHSTLHICFSVWAFKTGGTDQIFTCF